MKKCRALIKVVLVAVILAASFALAADFKYVGSKKSDKYHYPTCKWPKKINPENQVTFASAKDAQTAGYVPSHSISIAFSFHQPSFFLY